MEAKRKSTINDTPFSSALEIGSFLPPPPWLWLTAGVSKLSTSWQVAVSYISVKVQKVAFYGKLARLSKQVHSKMVSTTPAPNHLAQRM